MSEQRFFGSLSFWRCMRHFWTYLGYLDECQRGVRSYGDSPEILRVKPPPDLPIGTVGTQTPPERREK